METPFYVPNMDDDFEEMRQVLRLIEKEWPLLIEQWPRVAAQLAQDMETLTNREYWARMVQQLGQTVETLSSEEYWDRVVRDGVLSLAQLAVVGALIVQAVGRATKQ